MARETAKGASVATGEVVLTMDSAKLSASASKAQESMARFEKSVRSTASVQGAQVRATDATTASMGRQAVASEKGGKALQRLGFAAHQVVGQTASVNQALQGVLGTMGPWGVAIGAGVGILLHFASAEAEATKKAVELNDELRKQAGLRREAIGEQAGNAIIFRQTEAERKRLAAQEKEREQIAINAEEEHRAIDVSIAMVGTKSKQAEVYRRRQAELNEETLRAQAKISDGEKQIDLNREADAVAHEERVRRLTAENEKSHKAAKAANDESYAIARRAYELEKDRAEARLRLFQDLKRIEENNERDREEFFEYEDARFERAMERAGQLKTLRTQVAGAGRMREIEVQEATGQIDRTEAIEAERVAKLQLLEESRSISEDVFEREQRLEEARRINHSAEMARMEEEQRKRMEWASKAGAAAQQIVGGLLNIAEARKRAMQAAKAQGKTDEEAARAGAAAARQALAGELTNLRNRAIMKVIEETALGIGAQATTWGIPNPASIGHFASAGVWAVLAGGSAAGAAAAGSGGGGGMGGGGAPGGGSSTGGGTSPRSGSYPSAGGPIPGSPGARPPGPSANAPRPGPTFNGPVYFMGTPTREMRRQYDEMLEQGAHDRKPRRSTG